MPGASTANDFSMKTWQPLATAYSRWIGRKAGRRGQEHHAAGAERIDGLLVGVQADELPLRRHVDLLGELAGAGLRGWSEPGIEEVGHGAELRRPWGLQGLGGGAGAASAATDQGDLDGVFSPA